MFFLSTSTSPRTNKSADFTNSPFFLLIGNFSWLNMAYYYKEFDLADQVFYSPPTPSNNLGPSGKCTKLPASPIYIPQSKTISTQTTSKSPPKVSRRRKTRIKNLKDFLDSDYNSNEKKKKQRLLKKKLNCYKNLQIYKRKNKVGKKASSNQQIFKNNILPYLCTINLQYKLLCSEVQNIKRLCRAIFNTQFKV